MKPQKPLLWLVVLFLSSCTTAPKAEIGTDPEVAAEAANANREVVVILGTNDIHGGLAPQTLATKEDSGPGTEYQVGGAATFASYVKALRKEFGSHLLWLDGGDQFQGTIESNLEKGAPMVSFFNALGLNAAAIGNHEFDFGLETLKARMTEANYPYLAANIADKDTGRAARFPNTLPHTILKAGSLRIGVIGLSTTDTPRTTLAKNVESLEFTSLKEATIRESRELREDGVQMVVLASHVGLKCRLGLSGTTRAIRKPYDSEGACGDHDEMVQLLRQLPAGTVDAVVAGHSHQIVHHWVAGVPVIQAGATGRFFNILYLTYDWSQKKVVTDKTRIEGPIAVCPLVFQNQNDCNGDRPAPSQGRGPLVQVKFHGQEIKADSSIERLLEPVFKSSEGEKSRVVGQAARPIEHERFKESELGNLVADAIREEAKADVALINPGGIRANLPAGALTYGMIYRTLPFDNRVSTVKLTGKELRLLMRIVQSGGRGFASVSGVRLKVLDPSMDAPWDDLNRNGKVDPWEANRLLDIKLATRDGRRVELQDDKFYTLATVDFLLTGGDDFGWFMTQIPAERVDLTHGPVVRDALIQHLAAIGPANAADAPLIDPADRRIELHKGKAKKTRGKRRRRR